MNHTIRLKTNEDFEIAVRWKDTDGTPYIMTAGAMQVRETPDAATPLLTADITLEAEGWVRARIPADDIAALTAPPERTAYDFVVTRSDGVRKVMIEGVALIETGVTR